jgi:hypothetical protein
VPSASGAGLTREKIVAEAEKFLGDPYRYGAAGPDTFDCSGLMQYVYRQLGVSIPRTSEEQYAAGIPIARDQLAPGDLVFSAGSDGTAAKPGHVGMYVGARGGVPTVLEAPHTGADVRYTPLNAFGATGYRQVKNVPAAAGSGASDASWLGPDVGGLLSIPGEITGFFSDATDDLAATAKFFGAFTRPSTWVRVGAGAVGGLLAVAGLVLLIAAAYKGGGEA